VDKNPIDYARSFGSSILSAFIPRTPDYHDRMDYGSFSDFLREAPSADYFYVERDERSQEEFSHEIYLMGLGEPTEHAPFFTSSPRRGGSLTREGNPSTTISPENAAEDFEGFEERAAYGGGAVNVKLFYDEDIRIEASSLVTPEGENAVLDYRLWGPLCPATDEGIESVKRALADSSNRPIPRP